MAGGLGYAPFAPGTFGSLMGVGLFLGGFALADGRFLGGFALADGLFPGGFALADGRWAAASGRLPWVLAFGIAVTALLLLGIRAAADAERLFGRADDGRIVVDEVVGQLIALSPLLLFLPSASTADSGSAIAFPVLIAWVVTGFVAFRVFDIWKPGPVRWAERRFEGGVGVMADDVVAGGVAALVLFALIALRSPQALLLAQLVSGSGRTSLAAWSPELAAGGVA